MKFKSSVTKLLITLLITAGVVTGVYFLVDDVFFAVLQIIGLFLPFLLAYLLSVLINPLVDKLEGKLKIPRSVATVLVILLVVGILGGIAAAIIWKIVDEIRSVYRQLPQIIEEAKITWEILSVKLANTADVLPKGVQDVFSNLGESISTALSDFLKNSYSPAISGIGNFAKSLPGVFVWIIVFLLSLYFMISDSERVRGMVTGCFSKRFLARVRRIQREIKNYLGGYVKAQLIIMSIAAVIIFLGLTILNIEFALLIALGIAILDALPFFGSGAVLWPWSLVSFIYGDFKMGIGLIVIYLAVIFTRQMIEPKIVSENIGVYPVFTLMSMYLGYKIFSIGGMILGPVILILTVSFYKAGAFDGIIRFLKGFFGKIKQEITEIITYIK